jgi:hypothetical protein
MLVGVVATIGEKTDFYVAGREARVRKLFKREQKREEEEVKLLTV